MTKCYSYFKESTWENILSKFGGVSCDSVIDLAGALNIATTINKTTVANTLAKPKPFEERFIYVSYYFLTNILLFIFLNFTFHLHSDL